MKKLLRFILFFSIKLVSAQTNVYHPFPEIYGDWWVRTFHAPNNSPGPTTDDFYFTTGDTIANSLTYKKVNYIYKGNATGPVPPLNYIFTGGTYSFAYRNDSLNRKVYILLADSTNEKLWYNFNLNIGDTLKNCYSILKINYPPSFCLVVKAVDSVLMCSTYYKSYLCVCPYDTNQGVHLTESMGFDSNFLTVDVSNNCTYEPAELPNTYLWSLDACPDGLGIKQVMGNTQAPNIYPNPANDALHVELEMPNEKAEIKLFDVNGKQILSQIIIGKTVIDVSSLNAGVYNLSLHSSDGVVNKRVVVVK